MNRFKVFGATTESGNEAILISGNAAKGMSQEDRQDFAAKAKVSACVFMETQDDGNDPVLDYYYPHTRSPLCLHASLAAARYLLKSDADTVRMTTSVGQQPLVFRKSGSNVFVKVAQQALEPKQFSKEMISSLLNCSPELLVSEPAIASVGSTKLLLELPDVENLNRLEPDLQGIAAWGRENGVNGFYAYVKTGIDICEARSFNHLNPSMEDLATGVAAGAISIHLKASQTVCQGGKLGNPCKIQVLYGNGFVEIGGLVVESFEAQSPVRQ